MFGLEDACTAAAFFLTICMAALCVIYAIFNRNEGGEDESEKKEVSRKS